MRQRQKTEADILEAKLLGQAVATLRISRAMTQRQVAAKAGLAIQLLSKIERGFQYPRQTTLKRLLQGMGVTFAALHRAQELVENPMGERDAAIDAPDFTPEEEHQAAVKLAQEAGKAVAHCCLAFIEVGARGWRPTAGRAGGRNRCDGGPAGG